MKKLFFLFTVFFASQSMALQSHIAVQGQCLRSIKPDRGSVSFYAESLNDEAGKALKDATALFQKARTAVKDLQLKNVELQTIEQSVNERRVWEDNKNVFKGYNARLGLKVRTTEIKRLGEVIAKVSQVGVKNMGSLMMEVSPMKLKTEQEACLEEAIKNAKSKAQKMARAAGAKVGSVISIREEIQNSNPSQPRPFSAPNIQAKVMSSESAASVDVGSEDLNMNVHVMYELK